MQSDGRNVHIEAETEAEAIKLLERAHACRGLGDAVAEVISVAAGILPKSIQRKIKECPSCHGPQGRRARLNHLVPDVRHPFRVDKTVK